MATTPPPFASVNPIPEPIAQGGLVLGLQTVTQLVTRETSTGTYPSRPNGIDHAGDGTGRLFVTDTFGVVYVLEDGRAKAFLDVRNLDSWLPAAAEAGLRAIAFHPEFNEPDKPGYGKFYVSMSVSEESIPVDRNGRPTVTLFDAAASSQHNAVIEFTATASDRRRPEILDRVDLGSYRELFRIEDPYSNHNIEQLRFNPNAEPGEADYGLLYVSSGDGGGGGDPYGNAQNGMSALGKILRVDPLEQSNGDAYGVPDNNPFRGNSAYLPEIYALGLRNPQNLSFDTGGDGSGVVVDIGQARIEEVNLLLPGANYGWDAREGTFQVYAVFGGSQNVPEDGFSYPVLQFDRSEADVIDGRASSAVTGGFVYRGDAFPELVGTYIFGDLVGGRIFYASIEDMKDVPLDSWDLEDRATIKELRLFVDGEYVTLRDLIDRNLGSSNARADLRFGQDEDGNLYLATKRDGMIYQITPPRTTPAEGTPDADNLTGSALYDTITGLAGNDTIRGLAGGDQLRGEGGNDVLSGGDSNDFLRGGDGNDQLGGGAGDDVLHGNSGNDVINGNSGHDRIVLTSGINLARGGTGDDVIDGGRQADTIEGNDGDDLVHGEAGDDRITGGKGDDFLRGGSGDDVVTGHSGDDRIFGDDHDDVLIGSEGDDQLSGGNGDDLLVGGLGVDRMHGGAGEDTADFRHTTEAVTVDLDAGRAMIRGTTEILDSIENVIGSNAASTLRGDADGNRLQGNGGNDRLEGRAGDDVLIGGFGLDTYDGGAGSDTVDFSYSSAEGRIDLGRGTATFFSGGRTTTETLVSVENAIGTTDDNTFLGTTGSNWFTGAGGADVFVFDNRSAFGRDTITDFNADDQIWLTRFVNPGSDGEISFGRDNNWDFISVNSLIALPIHDISYEGQNSAGYFVYGIA